MGNIGSTEIRIGKDAIATFFFGLIECFVGKRDDFFAIGCMKCCGGIVGRNTDRSSDRCREGTEAVGEMALFDRCTKLFGDGIGIGAVTFGQDDAEFFSTVTGGKVDATDVMVDDLTDLCQ